MLNQHEARSMPGLVLGLSGKVDDASHGCSAMSSTRPEAWPCSAAVSSMRPLALRQEETSPVTKARVSPRTPRPSVGENVSYTTQGHGKLCLFLSH